MAQLPEVGIVARRIPVEKVSTKRAREVGLKNAKIHVLEALLRLRQAACHPGLVDKKLVRQSSAKLDVLIDQVREVIEGGHKALVFAQFTRTDPAGVRVSDHL